MQREFVSGAGLGLRRALLEPLGAGDEVRVDFLEVAPENWIGIGGRLGRQFRELTERLPFLCHGLSLNLGGYAPLDMSLLRSRVSSSSMASVPTASTCRPAPTTASSTT